MYVFYYLVISFHMRHAVSEKVQYHASCKVDVGLTNYIPKLDIKEFKTVD